MITVLVILGIIDLGVIVCYCSRDEELFWGAIVMGVVFLLGMCLASLLFAVNVTGEIGEYRAFLNANRDVLEMGFQRVRTEAVFEGGQVSEAMADLPNMEHSTINAKQLEVLRARIYEYNMWLGKVRNYKQSPLTNWLCWYEIPNDFDYVSMKKIGEGGAR